MQSIRSFSTRAAAFALVVFATLTIAVFAAPQQAHAGSSETYENDTVELSSGDKQTWTLGSEGGLTFGSPRQDAFFASVSVGSFGSGTLAVVDSKYVTHKVAPYSTTAATISAAYLNTLKPGTYNVQITSYHSSALDPIYGFTEAKGTFTVVSAPYVPMYRMYNKWTGEHLFTADKSELDKNVKLGWKNEGVAWKAPSTGEPVYRLYNKWSGDHHYTRDKAEYDKCIKAGWKGEGTVFCSGGDQKVLRLYNKYVQQFFHHYTMDVKEFNKCKKDGWKDEGIGWYGYAA